MSAVWWNPNQKVIVADSYQTATDFIAKTNKIAHFNNFVIGTCGDARFRNRFTKLYVNSIEKTDGLEIQVSDSSAIVYDKVNNELFYITVISKIISIYTVDASQYYAIGYGAPVVIVLGNLGYSDQDIGMQLEKHIPYVRGPFITSLDELP
jgi:hypothetical protein